MRMKLWDLMKEKLKTELSDNEYKFFEKVKAGDLEPDHVMRIICDNSYVLSIMQKVFDVKLKRVLMELGYPMVKLVYEVKKDEKKDEEKDTVMEVKELSNEVSGYGLNSKYTFENFVTGKNNEMAYTAARAVAHAPGSEYNPFFIYGGVGLGKTHLLHAIGNDVLKRKRNAKILLITSEDLISKIVDAIQRRKMNEFRNKIRTFEILLIDDIHFLAGADFSQEALFHIFNSFYNEKKQVVFTADRAPWELDNIAERLVDRFSWGLVTDIKPPEYETRLAILKLKAQERGLEVSDDVLELIAKNVKKNVRLLESCIVKLYAIQSSKNIKINLTLAHKFLSDIFSKALANDPQDVLMTVSEYYNLPKTEIMSKKQKKELVQARQISMFIMKNVFNMPIVEIARFFGKDHTTVLHAIEKVESLLNKDEKLKNEIFDIEKMLKRM
ncbi:MAG: chromosomal replication initiator protein DnaA [Candidatus Hydrothermales bacterium]